MSKSIHDFYLNGGDIVAVGDDAEFEQKHPRKGGKFVKKGEQGGAAEPDTLMENLAPLTDEMKKNADSATKELREKFKGKVTEHEPFRLVLRGGGANKGKGYFSVTWNSPKDREQNVEAARDMIQKKMGGDCTIQVENKESHNTQFWIAKKDFDVDKMASVVAKRTGIAVEKVRDILSKKFGKAKEADYSKMSDVELGKAHADAVNSKNAELADKIAKEQNRRYAVECSKMTDEELEKAIKDNKSLVERYGKKPDNPYVKDLEIAENEMEKRVEAEADANSAIQIKHMRKERKEKLFKEFSKLKSDKTSLERRGFASAAHALGYVIGFGEVKDTDTTFIPSTDFERMESKKEMTDVKHEKVEVGKGALDKVLAYEEKKLATFKKLGWKTEEQQQYVNGMKKAVKFFFHNDGSVAVGDAAEWNESAHPRAKDGRFGKKAGEHGKGGDKGFKDEAEFKKFNDAFGNAYDFFYDNEDPRETLYCDRCMSERRTNKAFAEKMSAFAEKRKDPLTSDRELAAFWAAENGIDPSKEKPTALETELHDLYRKGQQLWLNDGDQKELHRINGEYRQKWEQWLKGDKGGHSESKSKGAIAAEKVVGGLSRYWQDRYKMLDAQGHSLINAVFDKVQTKNPDMLMKQSIMLCETQSRYESEYAKRMSQMSVNTGLPVSELETMRDKMKDMLATDEPYLHLESDSHVFEYHKEGDFNVWTKDSWYRMKDSGFLVRKAKELNTYVQMFKESPNLKRWEGERNIVTSILAERSGSGK